MDDTSATNDNEKEINELPGSEKETNAKKIKLEPQEASVMTASASNDTNKETGDKSEPEKEANAKDNQT